MKKQFLQLAIRLLSITAVITSCKKDGDDPIIPAQEKCYMTSIIDNDDSKDSTAIIYNTDNKVIKLSYYDEDKNPLGYELYTYALNKILQSEYDENDVLEHEYHHYLNTNGTINHSTYKNIDGNYTDYDTIFYFYEDGYNVKEIVNSVHFYNATQTSKQSDTIWYTYSDGNKVKMKQKRNDGVIEITDYVYDTLEDKNYISGQLIIPGVYGKPSKNLIKSSSTNNDANDRATFTYQVNAKGLIINSVSVYTSDFGTDTYDYNFVYTCK